MHAHQALGVGGTGASSPGSSDVAPFLSRGFNKTTHDVHHRQYDPLLTQHTQGIYVLPGRRLYPIHESAVPRALRHRYP